MPWALWLGLVWASFHNPKGCGFSSWSGHTPGLQVQSQVGARMRGYECTFFSQINVSLPLSLKSCPRVRIKKKKLQNRQEAPRSWKSKKKNFPLKASRSNAALPTAMKTFPMPLMISDIRLKMQLTSELRPPICSHLRKPRWADTHMQPKLNITHKVWNTDFIRKAFDNCINNIINHLILK